AAMKARAKLAAYWVLVMGLAPTAFRFGHSLADSSIVQRLIRITLSFSRHILCCVRLILWLPCSLLPFGDREGAGKVDVIVVYKVDRLTRSLADFAKLVVRYCGRDFQRQ